MLLRATRDCRLEGRAKPALSFRRQMFAFGALGNNTCESLFPFSKWQVQSWTEDSSLRGTGRNERPGGYPELPRVTGVPEGNGPSGTPA